MKSLLVAVALISFPALSFADPCPTSLVGSCSSPENTAMCTDAVQDAFAEGAFETQCNAKTDSTGDTYTDSTCATDGLVGSCLLKVSGKASTIMRLYVPISLKVVESICAQAHGTVCQ